MNTNFQADSYFIYVFAFIISNQFQSKYCCYRNVSYFPIRSTYLFANTIKHRESAHQPFPPFSYIHVRRATMTIIKERDLEQPCTP